MRRRVDDEAFGFPRARARVCVSSGGSSLMANKYLIGYGAGARSVDGLFCTRWHEMEEEDHRHLKRARIGPSFFSPRYMEPACHDRACHEIIAVNGGLAGIVFGVARERPPGAMSAPSTNVGIRLPAFMGE